jgi:hypothetical protein
VKHLLSAPLKGRLLALSKNNTRLERVARSKRSSFLRKLVTYGRKKFNNIGPWAEFSTVDVGKRPHT